MATTYKKSVGQLFGLLRCAPRDTHYDISQFLMDKICRPLSLRMDVIGDRTLTRHLNALLNGEGSLWPSSTRSRKASQASPIKRELSPFGIGDASMSGQWHAALDALEQFVNTKMLDGRRLRVGEVVCSFQYKKLGHLSENNSISLLVPWLLSDNDEPSEELAAAFLEGMGSHFRIRVGDPEWIERDQVFQNTWFHDDGHVVAYDLQLGRPLPKHPAVFQEVLECAAFLTDDDRAKATALTRRVFPDRYIPE